MRFETRDEAVEYIFNNEGLNVKPGTYRIRELLERLGNPQESLRFIHVGGTNGKGSTCAMTANILTHAGYRTGLYPSPHIEEFNERLQIDGVNIADEDLARIASMVADIADSMDEHPNIFEMITAMGMVYFKEQKVDFVVLEVGLGGLYDATNVIDAPLVAALTNIGLDHTERLGNTVELIAEEKSGIIKPCSSVVTYENLPSVIEIIKSHADAAGDRLYLASDEDISGYDISLIGPHQKRNASTVLAIIRALRDKGIEISEDAVREGLAATRWPARFEVLSTDPVFILDGGHNPQCAHALKDAADEYIPGQKVTFIMGMLSDKNFSEVIDILKPVAEEFITVTPDSHRALKSSELCEIIKNKGLKACDGKTVEEAIRLAESKGRSVIAFGSLYGAGQIRTAYRRMHGAL